VSGCRGARNRDRGRLLGASVAARRLSSRLHLGYRGEVVSPFVFLGIFELSYIGIGLITGPAMGRRRRAHFAARVLLTTLGLLTALMLAVTQRGLPETVAIRIWIALTVLALVTAPFAWYRSPGRFPGSDSDGPGGPGPDQPWPPSPSQRGDVPLLDAEQAHARMRDHNRPKLFGHRARRPASEPARTPAKPGRAS
jgi:hypothetical protein